MPTASGLHKADVCRSVGNRVSLGIAGQRRLVAVMFIGGVTFAEIAALRWLSNRSDVNADFLVCTTKLVSGNSLLSSCIHDSVLASMAQAQVV